MPPPPQEVEPMCEPPGSRQGGDARGGPCERSSHHRRRAASREARGAMRGTGQPLCSQTRTATCCSTCAALELWLLLQLNSLLRVPYVRMHFRLSDQASWVVASHKARFSGPGPPRTWFAPSRACCLPVGWDGASAPVQRLLPRGCPGLPRGPSAAKHGPTTRAQATGQAKASSGRICSRRPSASPRPE